MREILMANWTSRLGMREKKIRAAHRFLAREKKKWVPLKQIKINKRGELGVNVINPFGDTLTSKSLWI